MELMLLTDTTFAKLVKGPLVNTGFNVCNIDSQISIACGFLSWTCVINSMSKDELNQLLMIFMDLCISSESIIDDLKSLRKCKMSL